ncbi:NADP-dependent malic enzyme, partial [Monoglobus pectinilyticus]
FEIERRLQEELDIPVFHDDQHGTAIVVSAGIINALRVVNKKIEDAQIVINGAGSAGIAICRMLMNMGAENIILVDKIGAICENMNGLNSEQEKMSKITNRDGKTGSLADVMQDADVFIGVSAPNIVTKEMVESMADDAIVFAMANPTPEIMPDLAKEAGARVVGTGRSDFPNQINNVIAFPGIFRGALDAMASSITEEMKIAACKAIAGLISDEELSEDYIIPKAFDPRVSPAVAEAVAKAAK